MEEIFVPASVREVGKEAFRGCGDLQEVRFAPDSRLARVGEDAFAGVPAEVRLPAAQ